ncbi:sorting nexin-4-like [Anneissia japonica]|uniref:sorting nexin-4-like n=1 Tax=Anneissia japonica TaxID=1529436 RepID=UPI0014257EAA|nr:sorting nexin-4-like [Anneissia japonica]
MAESVESPEYNPAIIADSAAVPVTSDVDELSKIAAKIRQARPPRPCVQLTIQDGTLLEAMEINVSEQEKRTTQTAMGMKDVYTVYYVETRVKDGTSKPLGEEATSLWRRYSEFELLRNYLLVTYSHVVIPPLPEKRATIMWQQLSTVDNFDSEFIERRRTGLEGFLRRVANHHKLCQDKIFHGFLQDENGWKSSVNASGFQAKMTILPGSVNVNKQDSRLKSLNAAFRLKKPDKRFEDLKNYCTNLQNNITALLKLRAFFISYKDYIDDFMSEEELIADQLKEYASFADAVRSVCRKQEMLQYEVERAEENLAAKTQLRDQLQGTVPTKAFSWRGLSSKVFGPETDQVKEMKLRQVKDQIQEAEEQVTRTQKEAAEFVEEALKEIERFKKTKTADLKEIFINFSVLQIKIAKKGIATWMSTKECFEKM